MLSAVKAIRMVMASLVVLCHGLPWFQLKDDSWHPSQFPSLEMDTSNERFGGSSNFKLLPYIIKTPGNLKISSVKRKIILRNRNFLVPCLFSGEKMNRR